MTRANVEPTKKIRADAAYYGNKIQEDEPRPSGEKATEEGDPIIWLAQRILKDIQELLQVTSDRSNMIVELQATIVMQK